MIASVSPAAGGGSEDAGWGAGDYVVAALVAATVVGAAFLGMRWMRRAQAGEGFMLVGADSGSGGGGGAQGPGRRLGGAARAPQRESALSPSDSPADSAGDIEMMETARVMAASAAEAGTPMTVQEALAALRGDPPSSPAPASAPARGGTARGLRLGGQPVTQPSSQAHSAGRRSSSGTALASATVAAAAAAAATDPFAGDGGGFDSWDIDFDEDDAGDTAPAATATRVGGGGGQDAEAARARELEYTSNAVAVGGTLPESAAPASLGRLAPVKFSRRAEDDQGDGFDDDW